MTGTGPIRGLLFDKDGTLFDFHRSWAGINLASAQLASRGDDSLRLKLLDLASVDPGTGHARPDGLMAASSAREIAGAWIAAGSLFGLDELTAALDQLFLEGASRMEPATDLPALFARLRGRGLALGIASSDSEAAVRTAAEHFGIAPFITFACGYDSGFGLKPTEGMALAFCRSTGLSPQNVAVIGDNVHDMEMGRRAGVGLKVGVLTGTGTRETLTPHASVVLASIAELEGFLGLS